jgi:hypothetical protein
LHDALWQPHSGNPQLTTLDGHNLFFTARNENAGRIRRRKMLWTITVILLVLWLLGVVGVYTVGAWIHLLLVLAIIMIIFNLLSGRRAV